MRDSNNCLHDCKVDNSNVVLQLYPITHVLDSIKKLHFGRLKTTNAVNLKRQCTRMNKERKTYLQHSATGIYEVCNYLAKNNKTMRDNMNRGNGCRSNKVYIRPHLKNQMAEARAEDHAVEGPQVTRVWASDTLQAQH